MEHPDWHSIRPWSHPFALSVREITSVSATFILASTLNAIDNTEPSLASLGLAVSDEEENDGRVVTDTLSEGLSVKVNNSPWQRVILRVDEELDEAVIIVFGLAPGRQYDIELGITPGEEWLRSQITTNQNPDRLETTKEDEGTLPMSDSDGLRSHLSSDSSSISTAMTTSTLDVSLSHPSAFTMEDRIHQLNHTLSMLQSERETLIGSLKGARRDAQKSDASIRAEIDTLKRASDKYASVEHRARQKVLALQEAIKQTLAATAETNALVFETEAILPILRKQKDEAEEEYKLLKEKADEIRTEKTELEKKKRKRIESMQSELAGLNNKLEKLYGKQDKLEAGTIPELEEELKRIGMEIQKAEKVSASFDEIPEEHDTGDDHDTSLTHNEVSGSNPVQQPQWKKHSPRREQVQHLPIQRPIQILRHQPQQPVIANRLMTTRIPPSTSSTSTLSGLARPFEPSPTRQAQLQSSLQSSISTAPRSDLNPSSTVFSPRLALAYQQNGSKWTPRTSNPDVGGQT